MSNFIQNKFIKNTKVNPETYKPLRFVEFFKRTYYIPLVFGYSYLPFPISQSRFVRIAFVFYSLIVSIGSSVTVLSYVKNIHCSPYMFVAFEYVTAVCLLLLTNTHTREEFFRKLEVVDEQLHVSSSSYKKLQKITLTGVVAALFTRILYSTALCYSFRIYCDQSPIVIFISGFVLIAVDTNQTPRLIVFHLVKSRMRLLKTRIERLFEKEPISIIGTKDKVKHLILYQDAYKNILDCISSISKHMNFFFMLSLVCSFPKIMFLLYNIIVLHKKGVSMFHLMILGLEAMQWGLIACLPGLIFEMTRAQVDKIKLFLLQYYNDCRCDITRHQIKEFLSYMELRPCQYYLYRLIPVDITLPVGLMHLCTTYLIVMIQFSHLFEDST